jgi:hypothetical protein
MHFTLTGTPKWLPRTRRNELVEEKRKPKAMTRLKFEEQQFSMGFACSDRSGIKGPNCDFVEEFKNSIV